VLDADATVAALSEQPEQTALMVDFDGSLAPIVEEAEDARPLPGARAVLEAVAARFGRVAVVSGRPVSFLADQLPVPRLVLVGLYGMERLVDGSHEVDARVEPFRAAVSEAVVELHERFGALVEPKSGVSVTVHWRPEPGRAPEIMAAADAVASRLGLEILRTRMAVELRPPIAVNKANAVRDLIAGFATGAFAGDDTGDLLAFAELRHARRDGRLERSVAIGVLSPEAPEELAGAVDTVVEGPTGLVALLARVADEVGEPV
jgi:trehalose 6-phosphate phosphatase